MQPAVRIRGLRETQRAFRRMSGGLDVALKAELRAAAEPVAAEARSLASVYPGAKVSAIGPRVVQSGVYVTDRARTVTGLRGDFGALLMTRAMIPALEHNVEGVEQAAERAVDAIETLGGF